MLGHRETIGTRLRHRGRDLFSLKPVVVPDAGFDSAANIAMLRERGYAYLINMTRGGRANYTDLFEEETFATLPDRKRGLQVEVKRVVDPDDAESHPVLFLLARNVLDDRFTTSAALVGKDIFLRGERSLSCAAGTKPD